MRNEIEVAGEEFFMIGLTDFMFNLSKRAGECQAQSHAITREEVATVTDQSGAKGMAFLASTYDRNLIDNIRVGLLPAEVPVK